MPHPPMPEGPYRLSDLQEKVRNKEPLTKEERDYLNACFRRYEAGRLNIRTRPENRAQWKVLAGQRGMSESEWCEERILVSLRPEGPEVKELRERIAKREAEIDLQRKQFSDLALERTSDKERMRELERDLRALVGLLINVRG